MPKKTNETVKFYSISTTTIRKLSILVGLLLLSQTLGSRTATGANDRRLKGLGRIINGDFVDLDTYPWFTSLLTTSSNYNFCGGQLIAPDVVLTAAHCTQYNEPGDIKVRIGSLQAPYQTGNNGGQEVEFRNVVGIWEHPDYDAFTVDNDFALLKLDSVSTITPIAIDNNNLSDNYTGKSKVHSSNIKDHTSSKTQIL